jgi:regulator of protease activity HflC (stomatin/prohibitin superfamily)
MSENDNYWLGLSAKNTIKVVAIPLVGAITILNSFYSIESGQVGVLKTFGKYDKEERGAGLHFKIPFVQNVIKFNTKVHVVTYARRIKSSRESIIFRPRIGVLDKNNQDIEIELSVQYQPFSSEASEILSTYGQGYFSKTINPIIREVVRDVIGEYEAETIAINRKSIALKLKDTLINRYKDNHQFKILEVSLRKIILPKTIRDKINQVQIAKQEEQRLIRVAQQAKRNQEIKTIEINTRKIEIITTAKADAEQKRIQADARAYQITAEADARAKANKVITNSISPMLINYNKINRWNGEYLKTYVGSGMGKDVILNLGNK